METRNIAVACFIGGALCCAVALMFAPVYWWLGLIAGMAGGYISYEFREVCRAVPIALRAAGRGGANTIAGTIAWFNKPRYVFYSAAILTVPICLWLFSFHAGEFWYLQDPRTGEPLYLPDTFRVVGTTLAAFLSSMALIVFFAGIGTLYEDCYWYPFLTSSSWSYESENERIRRLENLELHKEPMNYRNLSRWFLKGVGVTILFFVWYMWKWIAVCIFKSIRYLSKIVPPVLFGVCRFVWHMFKLIHSKKRVLCAIDGTLGGAISYIWLASSATSFQQQMMLVIFGGLLGGAFGIAHWEISKKMLHVSVSAASA